MFALNFDILKLLSDNKKKIMNFGFFSKGFFKVIPLWGAAAFWACPQPMNAETAVENDAMRIVQQTVEVKGVVYDATGMPVIGASVVEKGNPTNGVITDLDGNFTLKIPTNGVIEISYIGYATQEVQATPGKILNITLQEDNQMLEEVVVVGYGVQKKVNLTGSVATVDGETLESRPLANATQSLQGLVPGLFIDNSNAGRPGATSSLQLRGQGNLSGNAAPYVLVDGVEMDLADVNPNDIENISVLKDAAASSIYGARAAYGVILVTTKKGKEGKARVSYQATFGWSSPTVLPDVANAYEYATYFNAGNRNAGIAARYSDAKLQQLQQYMNNPEGMDPWAEYTQANVGNKYPSMVGAFENTGYGLGNVDYFDLHYKNAAFKQNHNVSISGGGEKAQYYVSGGMYNEEGLLRYADMNYRRFNFNANITSQVTDWLKLKVNTKYMNSDNKTPFGNGGLSEGFYHSLGRFAPTVSVIDPHGNFTELSMIPYLQSGTETNTENNNLTLTGGLEIQPLKDWHIFLDYTYRYNTRDYWALNVPPQIMDFTGEGYNLGLRDELNMTEGGSYTRYDMNNQYQSLNLYTNYTLSLQEKHNFTFMLGYQEEYYKYNYLRGVVTDLTSTTNPSLQLGNGTPALTDTRYAWATRGFFGRINYDFMGRYLIEVNGRYDGSSRFAKGNRWGFFPSVSLGWNIMRESFMEKAQNVLSNLKLRVSWGLLGNQSGAAYYTFASTMGVNSTLGGWLYGATGDSRGSYLLPGDVVDPNTTWEKVEHKNIGIDFGFLNNQLIGSFDVFQRDTRDMLGPSVALADFFGAQAPETNNAEMRNRGWEMTLQWRGKIGSDINYSIGGSLSDATSEVTAYEGDGLDPANNWYVGKKVGEIWGYRASGLIQTEQEAADYNNTYDLSFLSGVAWEPGDVKYLDLNGDKKIDKGTNTVGDMGDMTVIGNRTPRYQYTINGSISWKGLSLSMMFQGVGKRDWAPASGTVYFWGSNTLANTVVFKEHLDYWTADNPDAYYPKPYIAGSGAVGKFRNKTSQTADRYVQNAAYCRLKNLTISYDFPEAWVNKLHLTKAQIFFSGENLLTFTKLPGMFDPEGLFTSNSYDSSLSQAGKNYPMNRVFSFGIILNM